jgi:hypothetical protein
MKIYNFEDVNVDTNEIEKGSYQKSLVVNKIR